MIKAIQALLLSWFCGAAQAEFFGSERVGITICEAFKTKNVALGGADGAAQAPARFPSQCCFTVSEKLQPQNTSYFAK